VKIQKWVLLGLMATVLLSWTPVAVASNVLFDCFGNPVVYWDGDYITRSESAYGGGFGPEGDILFYTPTEAGSFNQQVICNYSPIIASVHLWQPSPEPPPYTVTVPLFSNPFTTSFGYYITLDQSGPLRFTDLTWKVDMIKDGSETTIFSLSADADLITYGGTRSGHGEYSLGYISVLAEITYDEIGRGTGTVFYGPGWYADGTSTIDVTYIISMTGNVVPIPPTALLLGSGLLGLLGWRRFRKG
jgi:hypothetical protein